MMNFAAVIPAAGSTGQDGEMSALRPLGVGTVLSRCIELFMGNDGRQVIVVSDGADRELEEVAENEGAEVVRAPEGEADMFASIKAGIKGLRKDISGFFVLPANVPLVRHKTVTRLMQSFEKNETTILYPRFHGKRGHPPLIHCKLIPRILDYAGKEGLQSLLGEMEFEAADLDVADYGVLHSIESSDDYLFACSRVGTTYPFPEECEQLWNLYSMPEEIREHCRAVARISVMICDEMNALRSEDDRLDRYLVEGSALTIDIGKGMKRHDAVGGEWLALHGFDAAAEIARHHSDLVLLPGDTITEREVVFLADKLVRGVTPVSLDNRYGDKLAMYGANPDARRSILGRHKRGTSVLRRFEEEIGKDIELMARKILA